MSDGKGETIRLDEELALVGTHRGWCRRVVNELIRLRSETERIINLLSDGRRRATVLRLACYRGRRNQAPKSTRQTRRDC